MGSEQLPHFLKMWKFCVHFPNDERISVVLNPKRRVQDLIDDITESHASLLGQTFSIVALRSGDRSLLPPSGILHHHLQDGALVFVEVDHLRASFKPPSLTSSPLSSNASLSPQQASGSFSEILRSYPDSSEIFSPLYAKRFAPEPSLILPSPPSSSSQPSAKRQKLINAPRHTAAVPCKLFDSPSNAPLSPPPHSTAVPTLIESSSDDDDDDDDDDDNQEEEDYGDDDNIDEDNEEDGDDDEEEEADNDSDENDEDEVEEANDDENEVEDDSDDDSEEEDDNDDDDAISTESSDEPPPTSDESSSSSSESSLVSDDLSSEEESDQALSPSDEPSSDEEEVTETTQTLLNDNMNHASPKDHDAHEDEDHDNEEGEEDSSAEEADDDEKLQSPHSRIDENHEEDEEEGEGEEDIADSPEDGKPDEDSPEDNEDENESVDSDDHKSSENVKLIDDHSSDSSTSSNDEAQDTSSHPLNKTGDPPDLNNDRNDHDDDDAVDHPVEHNAQVEDDNSHPPHANHNTNTDHLPSPKAAPQLIPETLNHGNSLPEHNSLAVLHLATILPSNALRSTASSSRDFHSDSSGSSSDTDSSSEEINELLSALINTSRRSAETRANLGPKSIPLIPDVGTSTYDVNTSFPHCPSPNYE